MANDEGGARAPYVVRFTWPGEAEVEDRATGVQVGWVRSDGEGGWMPFRATGAPVPPLVSRFSRAAAARAVWEASRG